MKKTALIITLIASLSGCVSINKQPLDAKNATSLKNQAVAQIARKKPDFAAMTAGKAAFAMLGAFAMISEGNSIIEKNNVPDPADAIAAGVGQFLQKDLGSTLVTSPVVIEADDASQIANSTNGKAKFAIDVQTLNWSFGYFPTDWSHYRVIYTAKARLINVDTKAVIAEGFCKRIPETNANAPTYDELLANEAKVLKQELSMAASECVKSLRSEMFLL